jgi:hypothetical protein
MAMSEIHRTRSSEVGDSVASSGVAGLPGAGTAGWALVLDRATETSHLGSPGDGDVGRSPPSVTPVVPCGTSAGDVPEAVGAALDVAG